MTNESDSKKVNENFSDLWHILLKYSQKNQELQGVASRIKMDNQSQKASCELGDSRIRKDDCTVFSFAKFLPRW